VGGDGKKVCGIADMVSFTSILKAWSVMKSACVCVGLRFEQPPEGLEKRPVGARNSSNLKIPILHKTVKWCLQYDLSSPLT
jgi:hypothetical protein